MKPGTNGYEFANGIAPAILEQLFDHVPETAFFVKDANGRYVALNQSLVERCGLRHKTELLGKSVTDLFPDHLAQRYARQDRSVLRTGRSIVDQLEMHWYARQRPGWCLTTKLPLRNETGKVMGVIGISRDIREPGDRSSIPASLLKTLEHLETNFAEQISPRALAQHARIPPVRFARLIKRIFRITPSQLITQTRLSAASELLRETSESIVEIAHRCGFSDHSAFTRAFRSATGLTPTQFRQGG